MVFYKNNTAYTINDSINDKNQRCALFFSTAAAAEYDRFLHFRLESGTRKRMANTYTLVTMRRQAGNGILIFLSC